MISTQLPLDSEEKAKLIGENSMAEEIISPYQMNRFLEISDAKWKKASEEYAAKRREIIGGYKTSELSILDGQLPNTLGRRPKLSVSVKSEKYLRCPTDFSNFLFCSSWN